MLSPQSILIAPATGTVIKVDYKLIPSVQNQLQFYLFGVGKGVCNN